MSTQLGAGDCEDLEASFTAELREMDAVYGHQTISSPPERSQMDDDVEPATLVQEILPSDQENTCHGEEKLLIFRDKESPTRKAPQKSPRKNDKKVTRIQNDKPARLHRRSRSEISTKKATPHRSISSSTEKFDVEGKSRAGSQILMVTMINELEEISEQRANLLQKLQSLAEQERIILANLASMTVTSSEDSGVTATDGGSSRSSSLAPEHNAERSVLDRLSTLHTEDSPMPHLKLALPRPRSAPPQSTPTASRKMHASPKKKRIPLTDKTEPVPEPSLLASLAIQMHKSSGPMARIPPLKVPMKFGDGSDDEGGRKPDQDPKTPNPRGSDDEEGGNGRNYKTPSGYMVPTTVKRKQWQF